MGEGEGMPLKWVHAASLCRGGLSSEAASWVLSPCCHCPGPSFLLCKMGKCPPPPTPAPSSQLWDCGQLWADAFMPANLSPGPGLLRGCSGAGTVRLGLNFISTTEVCDSGSSRCGATGCAASLQRQDAGSIPDPAQWVEGSSNAAAGAEVTSAAWICSLARGLHIHGVAKKKKKKSLDSGLFKISLSKPQ